MSVGAYKKQSLRGGWSRVDLLLQIYDRAIMCIEGCMATIDSDPVEFGRQFMQAQKALLALHSGLKPEENEVAFNIARLLHFAGASIEQKQFQPALKVLNDLRSGFAAVADEANELEANGEIPPIPEDDTFRA